MSCSVYRPIYGCWKFGNVPFNFSSYLVFALLGFNFGRYGLTMLSLARCVLYDYVFFTQLFFWGVFFVLFFSRKQASNASTYASQPVPSLRSDDVAVQLVTYVLATSIISSLCCVSAYIRELVENEASDLFGRIPLVFTRSW